MTGTPSPPDPPAPADLEADAEDLYEHAPCGYLSSLPDGTIVRVNQTLLDLTGHRREQLLGRRFADLLTVGGRIYHETHYAPLLQMHGAVREIAVDIARADGSRLPVLVNSVLVADADGQPRVIRTTVFSATDRRRYEQELLRAREQAVAAEARARLLAETLQASLIPPQTPAIPGLDLGAAYRPAGAGDEVGGDFYDVFEVGPADWMVVLGDVCGKGVEAARVTALARYTARAAAMQHERPSTVLRLLNDALLREGTDRFCTVVCARVRPSDHGRTRITVAAGGHPLPLRAGPRTTPTEVGTPGDLIGVLDDLALHDVEAVLEPGDSLTFFTDGVTEGRAVGAPSASTARGPGFYGEARLRTLLQRGHDSPAAAVARHVVDDVVAFSGGTTRDDIAVVVVKVPSVAAIAPGSPGVAVPPAPRPLH